MDERWLSDHLWMKDGSVNIWVLWIRDSWVKDCSVYIIYEDCWVSTNSSVTVYRYKLTQSMCMDKRWLSQCLLVKWKRTHVWMQDGCLYGWKIAFSQYVWMKKFWVNIYGWKRTAFNLWMKYDGVSTYGLYRAEWATMVSRSIWKIAVELLSQSTLWINLCCCFVT